MEEKQKTNIVNNFEKDSNCQVFNGDCQVFMGDNHDCVFTMPSSHGSQPSATAPSAEGGAHVQASMTADEGRKRTGEPTFFIHPSVDADQEWRVHDEIVRLASRQGVQEICRHLLQLSAEKKVLLPQSAEKAYNELVRLGMPSGEGYSQKTFAKHYRR